MLHKNDRKLIRGLFVIILCNALAIPRFRSLRKTRMLSTSNDQGYRPRCGGHGVTLANLPASSTEQGCLLGNTIAA